MSGEHPGLDPAVRRYYESRSEETRLSRGVSQLEAERTKRLVRTFAPAPPGTVCDVGGAAGAYSFWLAALGYEVHLVDPVSRLVEVARERNAGARCPLASIGVGDARRLPFEDGSADVVLLLGPLYHLPEAEERALALAEATRVLRPGGVLFAACITRWASILDGVTHDFLADPVFRRIVEEDLATGLHRNPTDTPGYFTTAFFHTPERFTAELEGADRDLVGVFGLEGPVRMLADFDERWRDPRRRADLLWVAQVMEAEPSALGVSPHLLGVCRKR